MVVRELHLSIALPQDVPPEDYQEVEQNALEGAVIGLWQTGRVSTREAADILHVDYHDYTDLLTTKGIPIATGLSDESSLRDKIAKIQSQPRM